MKTMALPTAAAVPIHGQWMTPLAWEYWEAVRGRPGAEPFPGPMTGVGVPLTGQALAVQRGGHSRPRRHVGLRFSRNACIPSRASGSWLVAAITSTA